MPVDTCVVILGKNKMFIRSAKDGSFINYEFTIR